MASPASAFARHSRNQWCHRLPHSLKPVVRTWRQPESCNRCFPISVRQDCRTKNSLKSDSTTSSRTISMRFLTQRLTWGGPLLSFLRSRRAKPDRSDTRCGRSHSRGDICCRKKLKSSGQSTRYLMPTLVRARTLQGP